MSLARRREARRKARNHAKQLAIAPEGALVNWTCPARFAAVVGALSSAWLGGTACSDVAGWQDVVSAEWRGAPTRVWSWRQAVILPSRILADGLVRPCAASSSCAWSAVR